MKRVVLALCLALPLAAQSPPSPPEKKPNQRLILLKYADPNSLKNILGIFGANVVTNLDLRALAIDAPADRWPAIEEAIARLDTPPSAPRNVELTVYFLTGSDREPASGNPVPPALQPVVTQLKHAFAFKNYRVLDSLILTVHTGQGGEASGVLSTGSVTQFKVRTLTISADGKIQIGHLQAGMRLPRADSKGGVQYLDTGINTDLDVKDGQQVVVGKTSMEGPDQAIFLVLSAKVL